MIDAAIGRVSAGENLTTEEMTDVMDAVVSGRVAEGQIGVLLIALRTKGPTSAEIAGAAAALRRHMTPIRTTRHRLVDTCGTGGDGAATFNISTAAALVVAASGVAVAKHGNRAITSRCGSADVLAARGVNVDASVEQVERCLDELGICFCFAPLLHPAMKRVAEVRRQLGVPTIFNLLGPLCNPAGAPFQLVGVGSPELRTLLAEALDRLGTRAAIVVQGEDGLDEVTLSGPTRISQVGREARNFTWTPADFGLAPAGLDALRVDGPEASAAVIRRVLDGETGPARDIVVLNAAAALWIAEHAPTPLECAQAAGEALASGAAAQLLSRLAALSRA